MTATIIISSLDEPYLSNTVATILASTPFELLDEIIIIDDCSVVPVSKANLPNSDKIRIVRNDTRKGLIWSRQSATGLSESPVIVSLDAHVKVQDDWLRPLIERLEKYPDAVVIPVTCGLDPKEWKETSEFFAKTGWDWNLDFKWIHDDGTDSTPAMAGHCFAFTKQWWNTIGGFDSSMREWGGENIEFTLKTWLAGGSVQVVRQSAVAHWFKSKFNYDFSTSTLEWNKARIAEVWFDDYKELFYQAIRKKSGTVKFGDVADQTTTRSKIQKKSFGWYLETIQPDLLGVSQLKNKHPGSRIAILGAGPSLDELQKGMLAGFDVVIGVNYSSLAFDCNYVVFHDLAPADTVFSAKKYDARQLFIPKRLKIANGVKSVDIPPKLSGCLKYDLGRQDSQDSLQSKNPPFFHHASTVHTAIHIAAFLGAKSIGLFGCDCKFAPDGRSHTKIVPQYNGGKYWQGDEQVEKYLLRILRGYDMLKVALKKWNIALLKYEYM